ncbi:recombinase family protein [Chloroflexota bacterium]
MKWRRKRVKKNKLPTGCRMTGFTYVKGKEEGEGIRVINEDEAVWIRSWRDWVFEDGLTINRISLRMRSLGRPMAPTTISGILANPAIMGKTHVYTCSYEQYVAPDGTHKKRLVKKPREEWVEIPNATPAIISEEDFMAIQAKLAQNKQLGGCKNAKTKYLWTSHLFCYVDKRRYRGKRTTVYNKGIPVIHEYYECPCKNNIVSEEKCPNRRWRRQELDQLLWDKVEALLARPEVILAGIKAVEADSAQADHFEHELTDIEAMLTELDEQQKKLFKQSLRGFPEELVIKENQKYNGVRAVLLERKAELETKIGHTQQAAVDMDNIKLVCEIVSQKLGSLTYEDKRLALKALDIKVWIKHDELTKEGSIPMTEDLSNLTVTSRCLGLEVNRSIPFHLPVIGLAL